ncbi:MAG: PIN domain-containing protein [Halobacteria archaeon]
MSTNSPAPRRFVVDTWAWLEYLQGSPAGRKVKEILDDPGNEIIANPIIVAELWSQARRRGQDLAPVTEAINAATVTPLDRTLGEAAGETHARLRKRDPDFPLADAFVLETARKSGAKVVTGDPHFRGEKDVVFIGR